MLRINTRNRSAIKKSAMAAASLGQIVPTEIERGNGTTASADATRAANVSNLGTASVSSLGTATASGTETNLDTGRASLPRANVIANTSEMAIATPASGLTQRIVLEMTAAKTRPARRSTDVVAKWSDWMKLRTLMFILLVFFSIDFYYCNCFQILELLNWLKKRRTE